MIFATRSKLEVVTSALAGSVVAGLSAFLVDQVFFSPAAFGGTRGMLTLYGEAAFIATGLAVLRVRNARARAEARPAREPALHFNVVALETPRSANDAEDLPKGPAAA